MILKIDEKITKRYVLNNLTEEQIIERFSGIPFNNSNLESNAFCSPFRQDKHPSCNYTISNKTNKPRIIDWTLKKSYDCFDVVGIKNSLNPNNTKEFFAILHIICKEFRLNIYSSPSYSSRHNFNLNVTETIKQKNIAKKIRKQIVYKIKFRDFNYKDLSYFGKAGLEKKDLKGFYPIEEIVETYINRNKTKRIYVKNNRFPCYGIYGGKHDLIEGVDLWKFYFPRAKKGIHAKFKTNGFFMQGVQYIIPSRICVITKSFKDVKIFNKIGLQSVALPSENSIISVEMFKYLKKHFDYIVSCLDYDEIGKKTAFKMYKRYGITPYFLTEDYKGKDPFEYCENNSIEDFKNICMNIFKEYYEDIRKQEIKTYNKLKYIQNEHRNFRKEHERKYGHIPYY